MSDDHEHAFWWGNPEAQKNFADRHSQFLESLKNIKDAWDSHIHTLVMNEFGDWVVLYLARMVIDDFIAIILLCANGYSNAAMQILRGMFERTVTLSYLHNHPDEIQLYWDYFWVDRHKLLSRLLEQYPEEQRPDWISQESIDETKAKYNEVKKDYQVTCKKCGTPRTNHTWSKKDMVTMAKDEGFPFEFIQMGYYMPLEEAHPKVGGILQRIEEKDDQTLGYKKSPEPVKADALLTVTHWLVLKMLDVVKAHFRVDTLEELLSQCWKDFEEIETAERKDAAYEEGGASTEVF